MSLQRDSLASNRVEMTGTTEDAMALYYQKGWTDGLPVVPPTEERVLSFVEVVGREPGEVLSTEPVRGRVITVEKVAIAAVMAGCLPEFMPVVLTAAECMVQPEFSLHGTSASTAGSAPLVIVNGPIRKQLGFASGHNLFGPGPDRRANATVGRAIRLLLINALQNHPGVLDRSTLGHPGKYSYCIAEDEESSIWEPLHVERGFPPEASCVTVGASLGPVQIDIRRGNTPEALLTAVADQLMGLGPEHREMILVVCPEHMGFFREAGWSKQQAREFLHQTARRSAKAWSDVFKAEIPEPGGEDESVGALRSPESLMLLSGGGPGGPWSALVPRWSKGITAASVTRQVPGV